MSPYLSHPLTASLRFGIVWSILFMLRVPGAEWFAFAYVAGYFEGREAGQLEHDLKNPWTSGDSRAWSPVKAWLGAALFFGWSVANVLQALAGIVPALGWAMLIAYLGRAAG